MNIKDYSYIVAVVDHGSFSKAAKQLFLSQPSLSAYIHNLEHQLGFLFFEKDKRTLTPEGELYVSIARQVIDLDQKLMLELNQLHRMKEHKICLGITPGRSDQYLAALYDRFNRPDCLFDLEISVDTSNSLIQKLHENELDLILLNHPQDSSGLISRKVYSEPLLLALHRSSPAVGLAYEVSEDKYRHLPVSALSEMRFITFPRGRSVRAIFDHFCAKSGIIPNIVQESPSMRSACKLVSMNFGATFVFDIPSEVEYLRENCECFHIDTEYLNVDYILASSTSNSREKDLKKPVAMIKETILRIHRAKN